MWARAIDGILLVSEECAEKIKILCTPGTRLLVNEETVILGKNMDLERTGDDDRFWFYSEDEKHALQISMLRSEDSYEVALVERKMYWFGALQEKTVHISSLSFPDANIIVTKKTNEENAKKSNE